ncbi:DUF6338 family protein [Streptosporangium canum]|uniref:DUF6338 family protein n=1 Tax=Streptosporangium canum TaxID=324952 RepID=UPI00341F2427
MPTTLLSLIFFVALLAPGFAYTAVRDSRFPERTSSAFRESTRVALASIVFDLASLGAFTLLRFTAPSLTPDVGRLIRQGEGYLRTHYASVTTWATVLLALAVGAAVLTAWRLPRRRHPLTVESSWWLLFHSYPERNGAAEIRVGCELTDGSFIGGRLQHFAYQAEETGDRELAVRGPFEHRPAKDQPARDLSGEHFVTISARQIKYLTVTYLAAPAARQAKEPVTDPRE